MFLFSDDVQEVAFDVKPHGNSKGGNPFYASKKSLIADIKQAVQGANEQGKAGRSLIYEKFVSQQNGSGIGSVPRSKKQVQHLMRMRLEIYLH